MIEALVNAFGGTRKVAQRLGVSQRTVQRWRKGTQQPSAKSRVALERVYAREMASDWDAEETRLFIDMLGDDTEPATDPVLQDLFDEAMFRHGVDREERESAYQELQNYLRDAYDIEFEDVFDWEDYREWYENAA